VTTSKIIKSSVILLLFITIYIVYSYVSYRHYGITADEYSAYVSGDIWYHYFLSEQSQFSFLVRYNPLISEHNRIYPTILYALTRTLNYEKYHFLNMLFVIPLFVGVYYSVVQQYKKSLYGLIAMLVVLLTPRFLGDIPANPKDVPFAVAYLISITAIYFSTSAVFTKYPFVKVIFIGCLLGYTQSLRAVGFTLYPVYFIWSVYKNKKSVVNSFFETLCTLFIALFVMCVIWPAVGSNFFANLKKYFALSSDYSLWDGTTLFLGKYYTDKNIPRSYMPIWLVVTMPLTYLVVSIYGFIIVLKKRIFNFHTFIACLIVYNFAIYFLINPVSYNGIRHFMYIVLLISLFASLSLFELIESTPKKIYVVVCVFFICYQLVTLYKISKLFPYQYIYFNELLGSYNTTATKFDTDYWGTSYKELSLKIKQTTTQNPNVPVKYYSCKMGSAVDYYLQNVAIPVDKPEKADYILCTDSLIKEKNILAKPIYSVSRFNTTYSSIYQKN
jgi:hypothetical protein